MVCNVLRTLFARFQHISLLCLKHILSYGSNTSVDIHKHTVLLCFKYISLLCFNYNIRDVVNTIYIYCYILESIICYVLHTWFAMFWTHYSYISNTSLLSFKHITWYALNTCSEHITSNVLNLLVGMFWIYYLLCFKHIICYVLNTWFTVFIYVWNTLVARLWRHSLAMFQTHYLMVSNRF